METSLVAKDTCSGGTEVKETTIGELLRELREKRGVSRAQLCQGICTVMTLVRYENNERIPNKFVIDCLLERLGKNVARLEFISSDEEFKLSQYRFQIEDKMRHSEYGAVEELLEAYSKEVGVKEKLHWQYIYAKRGELLKIKEQYEDAYLLLVNALKYTERQCMVDAEIGDRRLSNIELEIAYEIAEICYYLSRYEKAFSMFAQIEKYLNTLDTDNEVRIQYYPDIMYWIAVEQKGKGKEHLALACLEEAEQLLVKEYRMSGLERVLELKKQLGMAEVEEKLLAVKLINMSQINGEIPREGITLWENTVKQQF